MVNFVTLQATRYFELKYCQLSIQKELFNLEIRVVGLPHIFICLWEIIENKTSPNFSRKGNVFFMEISTPFHQRRVFSWPTNVPLIPYLQYTLHIANYASFHSIKTNRNLKVATVVDIDLFTKINPHTRVFRFAFDILLKLYRTNTHPSRSQAHLTSQPFQLKLI